MEALLSDVKYSVRQFRRAPQFVGAIVATLALAIGANTLLFGIAKAALFRALPYPDSSRLVSMSIVRKGADVRRMDEPTARLAVAANLPVFDSLAMYNSAGATLVGGEYPERVAGAHVSGSFFKVFAVRPAVGRTFTDEELRAGGPAPIVLGDAVWTRTFGRRATIVGERVTLDDRSYEVVGVMPSGFSDPGASQFWLPYMPRQITGGLYFIDFLGRLQPSSSIEQARAALTTLRAFGPPALVRLPTLAIDGEVLLFTLLLTIGTGLLFGLAPAFAAARMDPEYGLRGDFAAVRDGRWRPRRALVVLEIAAAVVLTLGTALLVKSFSRFQAVDRGFHADNVLTASITLSTVRYPDAASRRAFFDSVVERLRALPAVQSVAVSSIGPTGMSMTMDWPPANERRGDPFEIAVAEGLGEGHFRTFGIPIVEGRECGGSADALAVVLNAAMARRAYGDRSPLGEHLNLSAAGLGTRVVLGVAADVPNMRTKAAPLPTAYSCAGGERPAYGTVALPRNARVKSGFAWRSARIART